MARSNVKFVLDAEQASAVNAFLKVVDSQNKSEHAFKRTTRSAANQDRMMRQMIGTARSLAAGIVGAAGAGTMFRGAAQAIAEARRETTSFSKEITPLLSLGENAADIAAIRARTLAVSVGMGRPTQEAADAMFNLDSSAANLAGHLRTDLFDAATRVATLQNGDLASSTNLLIKFYQNYGQEVKDVTALQDKLFTIADKGALTLDELAQFGPDVAAAANLMRVSFDELGAAIIVASQKLGRNEKTFTGIRNIVLRMNNAQREGVELTGSFTNKLRQLQQVAAENPELIKKIFGDEAIAVIGAILNDLGQFNSVLIEMANSAGTVERKLNAILKDRTIQLSLDLQGFEQAQRNVLKSQAFAESPAGAAVRQVEAMKLGALETSVVAQLPGVADASAVSGLVARNISDFIETNAPVLKYFPPTAPAVAAVGQVAKGATALEQRGEMTLAQERSQTAIGRAENVSLGLQQARQRQAETEAARYGMSAADAEMYVRDIEQLPEFTRDIFRRLRFGERYNVVSGRSEAGELVDRLEKKMLDPRLPWQEQDAARRSMNEVKASEELNTFTGRREARDFAAIAGPIEKAGDTLHVVGAAFGDTLRPIGDAAAAVFGMFRGDGKPARPGEPAITPPAAQPAGLLQLLQQARDAGRLPERFQPLTAEQSEGGRAIMPAEMAQFQLTEHLDTAGMNAVIAELRAVMNAPAAASPPDSTTVSWNDEVLALLQEARAASRLPERFGGMTDEQGPGGAAIVAADVAAFQSAAQLDTAGMNAMVAELRSVTADLAGAAAGMNKSAENMKQATRQRVRQTP